MEGRRALSIFDWLGLGRQGTPYEVLETVQPVAQVPACYFPCSFGSYASTTALVVGTLVVVLPMPPGRELSRLWLHLWFNRTNSAVTDNTQLAINPATGGGGLVWQALGDFGTAFVPIIGGVSNLAQQAGVSYPHTILAGPPILSLQNFPLQVRALAAAAVGNLNLSGVYVDVPAAASFPAENL